MASAAILKNHKNRDITAADWQIFAKFGMITQNRFLTVVTVKKFEFPKSNMAEAAILKKKPLNRHIFAIVWPILMTFGMLTQIGPLQGTNH